MGASKPDSMIGKLFAGRFRLESVLGEGGMGAVYLATHEVLGRKFAIKVIRRELLEDVSAAKRFRREARTASRVAHPGVVSIFDFGHDTDGRPYIAMEFVEGRTLASVLDSERTLPVPRVLDIVEQMASALAAAHACQVVHRDLKPANVVLTDTPQRKDMVKVLDFGLAKATGVEATTKITAAGQTFGTPEYMSPEQCTDTAIDGRSDIYSLGIIAYEMLVGSVPFQGRVIKVMTAHVSKVPPLPSKASKRDDIPRAIDELVMRCVAKRREERFGSARALANAVSDLRADLSLSDPDLQVLDVRSLTRDSGPLSSVGRVEVPPPVPMPPDSAPSDDETDGVPDTTISQGGSRRPRLADSADIEPLSPFDEDSLAHATELHLPTVGPEAPSETTRVTALEELAYAMRDRGLGSPRIIGELARMLDAHDGLLAAEWELTQIAHEISEVEVLTRRREQALSMVQSQLRHELDRLDNAHNSSGEVPPDRSTRARAWLVSRVDEVESRLATIATERRERQTHLEAHRAHQLEQLFEHRLAVNRSAEALEELLRATRPPPSHTDEELEQLYGRIGAG